MRLLHAYLLAAAATALACPTQAIETKQIPGASGQLFVTGGRVEGDGGGALLGDVEVIDLSSSGPVTPCFKPAALPQPLVRHVGEFFKGAPFVCGGALADVDDDGGANVRQKYCFTYVYALNGAVDRWDVADDRLNFNREGSAASLLTDGEWWVTGGVEDQFGEENVAANTQKLLELRSEGSDYSPDLAEPKQGHNVVRLDENSAFITNGVGLTNSSFVFIRDSPDADLIDYVMIADQAEQRYQGFAGMIRKADGTREVVVAGGQGVDGAPSQIYSLDGDGTWRDGPALPYDELSGGASVQLEDTFFIVGGTTGGGVGSGDILWFDPDAEAWNLAPQVLTNPRWEFSALLAPENFVAC